MDAVFHITFYDPNGVKDHPNRCLGFYITNIRQAWDEVVFSLAEVASHLGSEYGAHDLSSSPVRFRAIGYTSYGVSIVQCDALMDAWRRAFVSTCPHCEVGPVCTVDNYENNEQILDQTKQAYEQQQAEQLRDRLNTHISVVQLVDRPKKI